MWGGDLGASMGWGMRRPKTRRPKSEGEARWCAGRSCAMGGMEIARWGGARGDGVREGWRGSSIGTGVWRGGTGAGSCWHNRCNVIGRSSDGSRMKSAGNELAPPHRGGHGSGGPADCEAGGDIDAGASRIADAESGGSVAGLGGRGMDGRGIGGLRRDER